MAERKPGDPFNVTPEEQQVQQERGQGYTTVTGQELAGVNQQVSQQQQQRYGGIQFSPPAPPLDLSRGQVPFMAQGFTPAGEPYYGGGVGGYLKGAFARLFNPDPLMENFDENVRNQIKQMSLDTTNKVVEALPFLKDYKEYVNAGLTAQYSLNYDPSKAIGLYGRYVKESAFGGLASLQTFTKPFRNQFVAQMAFSDIAAKNYGSTTIAPKKYGDIRDALHSSTNTLQISHDLFKIAEGKRAQGENWDAFLASTAGFLQAVPIVGGWPSYWLSSALGKAALNETELKRFNSYMKGSNMVYSMVIDEGKRQEYVRRYEAGENPDFLFEEMQNPWAELAGDLVFDTLNFIPSPAKAKRLSSAGQEFAKVLDPDIAKAVEAGTKAATEVEALEVAKGVSQIIGKKIEVASNKLMSWGSPKDAYTYVKPNVWNKTLNKVEGAVGKLFEPTASGKQFLVSRRVGTVMEFVAKNANGADEGAEVITMMLRATKGDDAAKAYLLRSKFASMVFSEAGIDTMAMLGKLSDDIGGTEKLMEAVRKAKSADELLTFLSPKMEKTIKTMLPSVEDMQKAEKAVKAGTATATDIALAEKLGQVQPAILAAEAVGKKLGKIYEPFNRFFAATYMGLSPGYAFRNLMSDTIAVFADQGAKAAGKNLLGGVGDLFADGAVTSRRIAELEKMGIMVPSAAAAGKAPHAAVDTGKKLLGKWDMRDVAERFERGSSVNIFANAVKREMNRAARGGILPDLSPLREMGVSQAAMDELVRMTLQNQGDVSKSVKAWKKIAATGELQLRKQIAVPDGVRGLLSHFGLDNRLDELIDTDPAKFKAGLEEIKDAFIKHAEKALKEDAHASEDVAQELYKVEQAIGDIDNALPMDERLFRARRQALNNVVAMVDDAFKESLKHVEVQARQAGTQGTPVSDMAGRVLEQIRKNFDEVAERTRKVTDSIFDKQKGLIYTSRGIEGEELVNLWKGTTIHGKGLGDVPQGLSNQTFRDAVYNLWKDTTKREWTKGGDNYFETVYKAVLDNSIDPDVTLGSELWKKATNALDELHLWTEVRGWDEAIPYAMQRDIERIKQMPDDLYLIGDMQYWQLRKYGWTGGVDELAHLVNETVFNNTKNLEDIPLKDALLTLQDWKQAFVRSGQNADGATEAIRKGAAMLKKQGVEEVAETAGKISDALRPLTPVVEESMPSLPRQLYEQMGMFNDDLDRWANKVVDAWDDTEKVFSNPQIDAFLNEVERVGAQRFTQAKAHATAVGVAERDFALHKYGDKTYMDVIAGFVYPYHYWYSRSTPKWIVRAIEEPAVIAAYGKHRRVLEGLHAGMPTWWKYNLSTNDLPGVDMENPMYFNLEATLNPINGITGVDFNDYNKRQTWYARLVDDMGKFGPSTFTPISWMVAAGLYSEGETEGAQRWMGRLIPATATLKAALNLANINTPLPYNELDPFVQIFSGGLDPYERRRVGRSLAGLVDGTNVTEEMAIDAAYNQSGPLWEQAAQIASDDRALGQLSSFAFGVGFKGRKESDMQIDNFYNEYFNLKDMYYGGIVSPDEYRDQLAYLKDRFPFMDTVLLSRRSGEDRDTAYAFNVFSRIPPGMSELYSTFGISKEELNQFYDDPYAIDTWDKAKRDKFLGNVYEMSAAFQLPDLATRLDWNAARRTYSAMDEQLKDEFGDKILEGIEYYYNEKDKQTARLFLDAHPEVAAALDRKTELIVQTPNLMEYYGGIDTLDRYLKGKMYDELEAKYGSDITTASQEYSDAKYRLFDNDLAKQIMNENPNLSAYWKEKSRRQDEISRTLALFGSKIDQKQVQIRPDYKGTFEQKKPVSYEEWNNALGAPIMSALDTYVRGGNLPKNVSSELDYLAGKYGYDNGQELAVEVMSSQVGNTGIPDAYIANAVLQNAPAPLVELIQDGDLSSSAVNEELQYLASIYGIPPQQVYQILATGR